MHGESKLEQSTILFTYHINHSMDGSWAAIARNPVLRSLTASQKTTLQAMFIRKDYSRGDNVWSVHDPVEEAVLILSGHFIFEEIHRQDPGELLLTSTSQHASMYAPEQHISPEVPAFDELTTGAFICDRLGLVSNLPHTMTLSCNSATGSILKLQKEHILSFLDNSPITLLALLTDIVLL